MALEEDGEGRRRRWREEDEEVFGSTRTELSTSVAVTFVKLTYPCSGFGKL